MKKSIRIVSRVLALCILVAIVTASVVPVKTAEAKSSAKQTITKISKEFLNFDGTNLIGSAYTTEMKIGETRTYNFNDNSARYMYIRTYFTRITASKANTISKRMFGKGVSGISGKVGGGEWGCARPILKNIKVSSLGSGRYQSIGDVFWEDDNAETDIPNDEDPKIGTFKLILKKKAGSYYGFIEKNHIEKVQQLT